MLQNIINTLSKTALEQFGSKSLPKVKGNLQLNGISKPIEIIRDVWGIPHIYAQNMPDLYFAQGFVHAQDRLWQMELARRVSTGTLSELLGKQTLEVDILSRTLGFKRTAQKEISRHSTEISNLLDAYIRGINYCITSQLSKHPIEFKMLKHNPHPWQVIDIMSLGYMVCWQMSFGWDGELLRAKMIELFGEERAAELDVNYTPSNPCILPNGIEFNTYINDVLQAVKSDYFGNISGSNSWAIAPEKTNTGGAILCNDPHLGLSAPAVWYENHLNCPELHVTGVTIPGLPGVLIGHNDKISWGATLAFVDSQDLFIEKFKSDNTNQYEFKNQWLDADVFNEYIYIKDEPNPHIEKVLVTHHGPIVSKSLKYTKQALALQSMSLQPARTIEFWLALNKAQNWNDFTQAMKLINAPQLNLVYADVYGNIGYYTTGTAPIRKNGNGKTPAEGWSGDFEWIDIIPINEMPHCLNPKKGYLITCNNKIIDSSYPYYLGEVWMNGYRAKRLETLIADKTNISTLDCQQWQTDVFTELGLQFAELYQPFSALDEINKIPILKQALDALISWDGHAYANSVGAAIYELCCYKVIETIIDKSIGKTHIEIFMGTGFSKELSQTNDFYGHDKVAILKLFKQPLNWWIENAGGRKNLLLNALKITVNYLQHQFGNDINNWQWGKIHTCNFIHLFGNKKAMAPLFNIGPFAIGGDNDTLLQAGSTDSCLPPKRMVGPSYRQIIDMNDLSKSMAILPPGQSGHLASKHYNSQINKWLQGELRPIAWTKEQVQQYTKHKLTLKVVKT